MMFVPVARLAPNLVACAVCLLLLPTGLAFGDEVAEIETDLEHCSQPLFRVWSQGPESVSVRVRYGDLVPNAYRDALAYREAARFASENGFSHVLLSERGDQAVGRLYIRENVRDCVGRLRVMDDLPGQPIVTEAISI